MKPLVRKMWAVKFLGKPQCLKPIFYNRKVFAEQDLDVAYQPDKYKVVRIEVRELKGA